MNRGGLLLYVKEKIPSKLANTSCFSEENEAIALEFSISNKKWLLKHQHKMTFLNKIKTDIVNHMTIPY